MAVRALRLQKGLLGTRDRTVQPVEIVLHRRLRFAKSGLKHCETPLARLPDSRELSAKHAIKQTLARVRCNAKRR